MYHTLQVLANLAVVVFVITSMLIKDRQARCRRAKSRRSAVGTYVSHPGNLGVRCQHTPAHRQDNEPVTNYISRQRTIAVILAPDL